MADIETAVAASDIKSGEGIVTGNSIARAAYEGERRTATAVEDIAKGDIIIVDRSTGLAKRSPTRRR